MRVSILHPTGAEPIVAELQRRGHVVCEESPDVGYVRTCTYPPWREKGLRRLIDLQVDGVPSLPSAADGYLYDDKRAQVHVLDQWLPDTNVVTSRDEATAVLLSGLPRIAFPFVSKSAEGASSRNVRLIRNRDEAEAEAAAVFGQGLRIHRGFQRGYLIWQEFVAGNDHDIRVVVNGENLYGLWRHNRKDVPFASGSGRREIITNLKDSHVRDAFALAIEIADALGTRWACFDFVSKDGRPLVLEVSFSWLETAYADCPVFDRQLNLTRKLGVSWTEFCVDELERLVA